MHSALLAVYFTKLAPRHVREVLPAQRGRQLRPVRDSRVQARSSPRSSGRARPSWARSIIRSSGVQDFGPYLTKVRAAGADVVITSDWGQDFRLLLQQGRALGWNVKVGIVLSQRSLDPAGHRLRRGRARHRLRLPRDGGHARQHGVCQEMAGAVPESPTRVAGSGSHDGPLCPVRPVAGRRHQEGREPRHDAPDQGHGKAPSSTWCGVRSRCAPAITRCRPPGYVAGSHRAGEDSSRDPLLREPISPTSGGPSGSPGTTSHSRRETPATGGARRCSC